MLPAQVAPALHTDEAQHAAPGAPHVAILASPALPVSGVLWSLGGVASVTWLASP